MNQQFNPIFNPLKLRYSLTTTVNYLQFEKVKNEASKEGLTVSEYIRRKLNLSNPKNYNNEN